MGIFLNSVNKKNDFVVATSNKYFVDKSGIIEHFNHLIDTMNRFVCITRPRRFGKTINASMLASYYSKNLDTKSVFDKLNVSKCTSYLEHLNKHNVIYISFNTNKGQFETYNDYISYFKTELLEDLKEVYPNISFRYRFIPDVLNYIYKTTGQGFVFIFDEWDHIFNNNLYSIKDRQNFLDFLEGLLKGQSYVEFAYMTGVLPIAKYSDGSTLNNFNEYTMLLGVDYDKYFGFTDTEVQDLCSKQDKLSLEELKEWYNGYYTTSGLRVYNPRSVVSALTSGVCQNYWTNTGKMNEISFYIQNDIHSVKKDILDMVAGTPVFADLDNYTPDKTVLETREDVLSLMTILGFVSYHNNQVIIPNKELMKKFMSVLKGPEMGNLSKIVAKSNEMLDATLSQDSERMANLLDEAHAIFTTYFSYNNESALTSVIILMYLSARARYNVSSEDVAGLGRSDFIFYPLNPKDTSFILELKVDDTPEAAIQQIMDKKYYLKLEPYLGKKLAIGISYYKDSKKHSVKIVEI